MRRAQHAGLGAGRGLWWRRACCSHLCIPGQPCHTVTSLISDRKQEEDIKGRCHWGEHQNPAAPVCAQHLRAHIATASASCWPLRAVQDSKADASTPPHTHLGTHPTAIHREPILHQKGKSIPDTHPPWILPQSRACIKPRQPLTCCTSLIIRSRQWLVATILHPDLGFGNMLSGASLQPAKESEPHQLQPGELRLHHSLHHGA